jgi:AcrR family transcriptional regulator
MSLLSQKGTSSTRERILDAAARQVEAVGLSRTTLTDVANAAGLSRMTIYRNYASVEQILQDLMTREFNGVVDRTIIDGDGEATEFRRERIVAGVITTIDSLSAHPLFLRLLAADPDLLLPYITERPGRFQQYAKEVLSEVLARGIELGEIRDDDPARLTDSMLLALRGYAFVDKSSWTRRQRAATLGDLALMLDGLLAPEDKR